MRLYACSAQAADIQARGMNADQPIRTFTSIVGRYLDIRLVPTQILWSDLTRPEVHVENCGTTC